MNMDFLELAKNRYSERFFDPRPVEQEKLDRILEAGRVAPTACNYQPQRFYIIRSKEAMDKLKRVTRFHYNAPLFILVCYDEDVVWCAAGDRHFPMYNSGDQDSTIAATSMMFEAEEQGVHTIWVRGFDAQSVIDVFELPENIAPVMLLGLGYPNEKAAPNPWHFKREPMEHFVQEL